MKIVRIVIKGASGYGPVDEAYEDKVTLTPSSISYENKPHPCARSDTNIHKKWSYTTNQAVKEATLHRSKVASCSRRK